MAARGAALMVKHAKSAASLLDRLSDRPAPDAQVAVDWIRQAAAQRFPGQDLRVAAYLGSPGALRKLSAVVLDHAARPVLFAKVASTPAAGEVLRHEAEILDFAQSAAHSVMVPRVVSLDIDERGTLLLLTPVAGSRFGNRAPWSDRHVRFVSELHAHRIPFDGLAHRDALQARLSDASDTSQARFLTAALSLADNCWGAVHTTHFSHGDLTPWNCLDCGSTLGVIDWEMAGYRVPGWTCSTT